MEYRENDLFFGSILYVLHTTLYLCIMPSQGDEIRRKLEDYNKVSKIQRNLSVDNSHLEKEIRDLKTR